MEFKKTIITGLFIGKLDGFKDNRGVFTRVYCADIFKKKFNFNFKQANICSNSTKGTFRGLHYQINKYREDKIIQILEGETFHVILDLRKKSKSFNSFFTYKLNEKKNDFLIIPKGCAHGYLTLKHHSKIIYFTTNFYNKKYSRGINIKDSMLKNLKLPYKIKVISQQDKDW
jgi:dTDP-4-dehydrorhamnose 3,5-epimerase